jgi:hypothetical protein
MRVAVFSAPQVKPTTEALRSSGAWGTAHFKP